MTSGAIATRASALLRWERPICLALAVFILLSVAWYWAGYDLSYRGIDYRLYMDATRRWLSGGGFYGPQELAGSFAVTYGVTLYPPVALLVFAPFTVLPPIAWWIVPLGLTAWGLVRLKPAPWSWPLVVLPLVWWTAAERIVSGNPVIWSLAALTLACSAGWPGVFVLLKPSLFPFAFVGGWRREWWVALLGLALLSLPFLPMWFEWLAVLRHAKTPAGLLYSAQEAPLLLIPLVAWVASPIGPMPTLRAVWTRNREPGVRE